MHKHHHRHVNSALPGSKGPTNTTRTAVVSGGFDQHVQSVSAEEIRICAYRKWESAGKPAGNSIMFWLEAEQELCKASNHLPS